MRKQKFPRFPKRFVVPKTRTFDGKLYKRGDYGQFTVHEAREMGKIVKLMGGSYRIVKVTGGDQGLTGYWVYTHYTKKSRFYKNWLVE